MFPPGILYEVNTSEILKSTGDRKLKSSYSIRINLEKIPIHAQQECWGTEESLATVIF